MVLVRIWKCENKQAVHGTSLALTGKLFQPSIINYINNCKIKYTHIFAIAHHHSYLRRIWTIKTQWKSSALRYSVNCSGGIGSQYCHWRALLSVLFCSLSDKDVKDYVIYKPHLMFFGLANCLPHMLFGVRLNVYNAVFAGKCKSFLDNKPNQITPLRIQVWPDLLRTKECSSSLQLFSMSNAIHNWADGV